MISLERGRLQPSNHPIVYWLAFSGCTAPAFRGGITWKSEVFLETRKADADRHLEEKR